LIVVVDSGPVRRLAIALLGCASLMLGASATASAATYSNPQSLQTASFGSNEAGPLVPYPSVIDVDGLPGTVVSARVTINRIAYESVSELAIVVVGPSGARVVLMDGNCQLQDSSAAPLTFTFDDAAATPLPGAPCSSGTFKPSGNPASPPVMDANAGPGPPYAFALSAVAGGPASGLWQLYAKDGAGPGIGGSIAGGWTLDLTTTTTPTDLTTTTTPTGQRAAALKKCKHKHAKKKRKRCRKKADLLPA
jgi:hypothetical protein